jgi:hypothetical protein
VAWCWQLQLGPLQVRRRARPSPRLTPRVVCPHDSVLRAVFFFLPKIVLCEHVQGLHFHEALGYWRTPRTAPDKRYFESGVDRVALWQMRYEHRDSDVETEAIGPFFSVLSLGGGGAAEHAFEDQVMM